jgi:hypothetical protein
MRQNTDFFPLCASDRAGPIKTNRPGKPEVQFLQETTHRKVSRSCCKGLFFFFFAGALSRGICTRQDRPFCGLVLKPIHGADEQVGFVRSCLVQNRRGEFYTQSS